jgi:hypothetical protein
MANAEEFVFAEPGVRCVHSKHGLMLNNRYHAAGSGLGHVECASAVNKNGITTFHGVTACAVVGADADGMCRYKGLVFPAGTAYAIRARAIKFVFYE